MKILIYKGLALILVAFVLWGVNACSTYQPYAYQEERDIKPGPGLFSGEDGEFTLFRLADKASVSDPVATSQPSAETEAVEKMATSGPESGR